MLLAFGVTLFARTNFLTQQKKFQRVRVAFKEKSSIVTKNLTKNGLKPVELNIIIISFKAESELEIYAKSKSDVTYRKIASYKICAKSGTLGPKWKQGDGQVPEGIYHIDRFNPSSSFYLSLGLNYPNAADKKRSKAVNLGGDIFIHGDCVTIGCMPMTNDKIKEIYLYALFAKNSGQRRIPVYIFPFKMTADNTKKHTAQYPESATFWKNLKLKHDAFMKHQKALK